MDSDINQSQLNDIFKNINVSINDVLELFEPMLFKLIEDVFEYGTDEHKAKLRKMFSNSLFETDKRLEKNNYQEE